MAMTFRIALFVLITLPAFAQQPTDDAEIPANLDNVVIPELPKLEGNCPTVIGPPKGKIANAGFVRRFMSDTPQRFQAPKPFVTFTPDGNMQINEPWPIPVGSTALSPRAMAYRTATAVNPWRAPAGPKDDVVVNDEANEVPPHAAPPIPDVEEELSFYPDQQPSPEAPPTQPTPTQPPVRQLSTALPYEMTVPMFVPTGPATGRSRLAPLIDVENEGIEPRGLLPPIAQLRRYPAPPQWDPSTVSCGQPMEYWHPLMSPGSKPTPVGLGFQLYDRFLNGGYGATDFDGQQQLQILNAIDAGLIPSSVLP